MGILFICVYNRFRSKISEALFNKYNKDKSIEVKSAGTRIDMLNPDVAISVKNELKKRKAKVTSTHPLVFDDALLEWADKIVVVADDVSSNYFPKWVQGKIERWEISDCHQSDLRCIRKEADLIDKKVKDLIKRLKTKKV